MIAARTLVLAGVAALFPALAMAQVNSTNQGYLVNGPNFDVVTAVGGTICVRTSDWTPARAAAAKACQQCTPELCPKPVAVAQAPATPARPATPAAPPAKKAPEKMLPQKINFSADALFDFDKAVLKPEGKTMLDELARTLQGANYEVIVTVGHADRFGSVSYNQKLSERRAAAVKDYLTSKEIPANKISTDGKGKSQPMTKPGECAGPKSAKVIACLQPDRRVDVDVTGSK
ncbi:MAG: OmpA family protein [Betaproteobacteria bacterium]|nr:OmpA family protein [Betaproteobacteria bacterium]